MKFITQSSIFIISFRLIIGGILVFASFDKIGSPDDFARDIANYHILPFGQKMYGKM